MKVNQGELLRTYPLKKFQHKRLEVIVIYYGRLGGV